MSRWPERLPHPALVFVVLAWGMNFVVIKFALGDMPVKVLMLLRYLLIAPVLAGYAVAAKQAYWPKGKEWFKFLIAGFMSTGLYMVLFLEGMDRIGAAQGAVCLATAPIWVSLFSVLTGHEEGRWQLFVGGLTAYSGVALVILMGTGERHWTPLGLALTLASAMVWAVSVVMMKPLLQGRPAVGVYVSTYPGAALVLLPYGLAPTLGFDYSHVTWIGWASLAYLVLVAGFAAFTAYYVGVREVGASKTAMIAYFVPVVAAISAWLLQGAALNAYQVLGIAVVLGGVALANRKPTLVNPLAAATADEIA